MWKVEEGALTFLFLGTATERLKRENIHGRYFHPQSHEVRLNSKSLIEMLQEDLWKLSEDLVHDYLD